MLPSFTLFNDKGRSGEVMKRLNQFGGWAGDVFKQCKDGVQEDVGADLQWMINQTERLADKIDLGAVRRGKVELYKQVQRKISNGLTPVIELEARAGERLDETTIALFGTDIDDLARLDSIRRAVHVALVDPVSREKSIYPATILHSGCSRPRACLPAAILSHRGGTRFGRAGTCRSCRRRARSTRRCWTRRATS